MSTRDDVQALIHMATSLGWPAEVEPDIDGRRPDVVIQQPEGISWIVEFKQGRDTALHMADLGQIAGYAEALARRNVEGFGGPEVHDLLAQIRLLLVTTEPPTDFFKSGAEQLGIDVLQSDKTGQDLAAQLVEHIRSK